MNYPHLFAPGRIGPLALRNRIVMSPMSTKYCTPDGAPTLRTITHYRARAEGGAGLVITEYAYIDDEASKASPGQLGAYSDELIPSLAELSDAIRLAGAKGAMQISHCGRQKFAGSRAIAPSNVPWKRLGGTDSVKPRRATMPQIHRIIDAYGAAALRVKRAGFDLVEIHGGHGYLVTQFLSPRTNRRRDKYGGSPRGRMQFLVDVVASVRSAVGPVFPISVRLSSDEFIDGGFGLGDTIEVARELESAGVSAIHVSAGVHESTERQIPSMYQPHHSNVDAARRIRDEIGIPVLVVGGITTPAGAEEILASGAADYVTLGRALLADPDFPLKAFQGRSAAIRPCIRCNDGCLDRPRATLQGTQCSVNFAVGRQGAYHDDRRMRRSATPRNVVIVGGGPAGMEAARIAARRGHSVTLVERAAALGGWLRVASVPEFKADLRPYLEYLRHDVGASGVRIEHSTVATPELVDSLRPDVVVLAAGSTASLPEIKGVELGHVRLATDVLSDAPPTCRIVVVGSSQVAIDAGLHLADGGSEVTLLHQGADFGNPALDAGARRAVAELYRRAGVRVSLGTRVSELAGWGVRAVADDGLEVEYPADAIVVDGVFKPRDDLVRPLRALVPQIWVIGDCAQPRKIYDAVHEGHNAALRVEWPNVGLDLHEH